MNRIVEGSGVKIDLLKQPEDVRAGMRSRLGGEESDAHTSSFRYSDSFGAVK